MYCKFCGRKIESSDGFCSGCGNKIEKSETATTALSNLKPDGNSDVYSGGSNKIGFSYFISFVAAFICLVVRVSMQEMYYTYESIMRNERVYGIDPDMKPLFTIIPVVAAVISALLLISDRNSDNQKKMTAFIIDAVIIALAVLFIWFDIPYDLFNF